MRTIERMLKARHESGLSCDGYFVSPQSTFDWWLERDGNTEVTLWEEDDVRT